MAWKLGDVQETGGYSRIVYSFSVQSQFGAPLFTMAYATENQAEVAREAMESALAAAITLHDTNGKEY